jgi:hypothetical protein
MLTLSGQTNGGAAAERGLPEARGAEVRGLEARRDGEPLGELSAEAARAEGGGRGAGRDACGGAAQKARCTKRGR